MTPLLCNLDAGGSWDEFHDDVCGRKELTGEGQGWWRNLKLDLLLKKDQQPLCISGFSGLTLGCIVNMSSVLSVDSRRSKSEIGMVMSAADSRATDDGAVS